MQSVSLCVFLSSALCLFFCSCARRAAQFVLERVLLLRLRDRSDSQTPSSHEWGHLSPLPQSSCMSVNRANWIILFGINKPQRLRTSSRFHIHLCCYCFFVFWVFSLKNSHLPFLPEILCWWCWDQTKVSWILRSWNFRMTTVIVAMRQSSRKRCETSSLRVSGQISSRPWESSIRYSLNVQRWHAFSSFFFPCLPGVDIIGSPLLPVFQFPIVMH